MAAVSVIGVIGSLVLSRFNTVTPIEERVVFNQTEASAVNVLDVEADIGNINIYPTSNEEILVELSGMSTRISSHKLTADVVDETLRVELSERQIGGFNVNVGRWRNRGYTLNIYLPEKQYDSVKVDSKVGSIKLKSLEVTKLNLHSAVGNIELHRILSEQTKITNKVGLTKIQYLTGNLQVEAELGNIEVEAETANKNMDIKSGVGSIDVSFDEKPENATFQLSSEVGRIQLFGDSFNQQVFGDGDYTVKIVSQLGSITVE